MAQRTPLLHAQRQCQQLLHQRGSDRRCAGVHAEQGTQQMLHDTAWHSGKKRIQDSHDKCHVVNFFTVVFQVSIIFLLYYISGLGSTITFQVWTL